MMCKALPQLFIRREALPKKGDAPPRLRLAGGDAFSLLRSKKVTPLVIFQGSALKNNKR
jgi:hypothetical protein